MLHEPFISGKGGRFTININQVNRASCDSVFIAVCLWMKDALLRVCYDTIFERRFSATFSRIN